MQFIAVFRRLLPATLALSVALFGFELPQAVRAAEPTVAVLNFDTQGLTSDWYGNFEPGIALSDLATDQLVNGGKFNIVERKHLADVMQEHHVSGSVKVLEIVRSQ